ncbi:S-type pyocin [Pseudomonas sp. 2848]|uniref:S-type pyocin domain-containing protein n=1 Tax=Pseudomonas sp. 2848 TaxID=2183926 RepID=UPI000DB6CCA5|nr:S-type pyocin domain-containing protein [Pseudomonas sp. 2848]PZW75607.1 S-type pyocin [Pseudomonas sp. 2848]
MPNTVTLPAQWVTPDPLPSLGHHTLPPLSQPVFTAPKNWKQGVPAIHAPHDIDKLGTFYTLEKVPLLVNIFISAQLKTEEQYARYQAHLEAALDSEIQAIAPSGNFDIWHMERQLDALYKLTVSKRQALLESRTLEARFLGQPIDTANKKRHAINFVNRMQKRHGSRPSAVYASFIESLSAAHMSILLTRSISLLETRIAALSTLIANTRIEAERAAAAHAEAERIAVETAARAEAERIAAEAAARAEAERIAAEAAARAEAERIAAEAAARAEAERIAAEAERTFGKNVEAKANTLTLAISGGPQLTTTATLSNIEFTLESAIRQAIQLLKGGLEVVANRVFAVGIGALVYSPALGNGELPSEVALGLAASTLLPELPDNLQQIAAANGSIALPYRIHGQRSGYALVSTSSPGTSRDVPVRALSFDEASASYRFTSTDSPPVTLSFPIVRPADYSTSTPATPPQVPIYHGLTLRPIKTEAYSLPAAELQNLKDCIYCFPAQSGLPPLYVVLSSPYQGNTLGIHSGRPYDPTLAGGPILDLDWRTALITEVGIELVKIHTGRFEKSDANEVMINRLVKILRGELLVTDTDKRFYTHELRELERYRALKVPDDANPLDGTWNNAHTATLEDYKLGQDFELLYTPEAVEADTLQILKEYP